MTQATWGRRTGLDLPVTMPSYWEGLGRVLDIGATFDYPLKPSDLVPTEESLAADAYDDAVSIAGDFAFIRSVTPPSPRR